MSPANISYHSSAERRGHRGRREGHQSDANINIPFAQRLRRYSDSPVLTLAI